MKRMKNRRLLSAALSVAMLATEFFGSFSMGSVRAADKTQVTEEQLAELTEVSTYSRHAVHDPSIIKVGSDYYVYGSHMGVGKSADLKNWAGTAIHDQKTDNAYYADVSGNVCSYENAFSQNALTGVTTLYKANGESYTVDFGTYDLADWIGENTVTGNQWAPDIIYNSEMGKYCMYLSLNGKLQNSAVLLLTSDSIDGPFVYQAPIVFSGFYSTAKSYKDTDLELVLGEQSSLPEMYNTSTSWGDRWPHAIDPCVYTDADGKLWLAYGSWSGGIYTLELDEKTGLRDYSVDYESDYDTAGNAVTTDAYFGKKIAGGYYVSGEGSYIQQIGNYYYLFMSYGFYSPTGGYNMRVFRSENPDGPFVDQQGKDARYTSWMDNYRNTSRGLQLMGNYQWETMSVAEVAQGHNSAFVDDNGNAYVIYHTKFADGTATHQLRVHQLYINADGWPVAAPFEYAGETVNDMAAAASSIATEDIAGEYSVILHQYNNPKAADTGTVEANLDVVTPVTVTLNADGTISGAAEGTWTETEGTAYATITLGETTYKGVFTDQKVENRTYSTTCFSAVSDSGVCVWGAKSSDLSAIANNAAFLIPAETAVDLALDNGTGKNGANIVWTSSDESVIALDGTVTPGDDDATVTLSRTVSKGDYEFIKESSVKVLGEYSDSAAQMSYAAVPANSSLMPVSSLKEATGVSLSFTLSEAITSDWDQIFRTENGEVVYLSVLNYGNTNIFEASATAGEAAAAISEENWKLFLDYTGEVTISYNVDGSISFYRGDDLMLTYAADTAIGGATVADLSKAMMNAVKDGELIPVRAMNDLSIGYAKDYVDTSVKNVAAGTKLAAAEAVSENTGAAITFRLKEAVSDNATAVFSASGNDIFLSALEFGDAGLTETAAVKAAAAGSVDADKIFADVTGEITISYSANGSISFYQGDELMLIYGADTVIGDATVADLAASVIKAIHDGEVSVSRDMKTASVGVAKDYAVQQSKAGAQAVYGKLPAAFTAASVNGITEKTGVSYSFKLSEAITSDWDKIFQTEDGVSVYLSVLNNGGNNNVFEASATASSAAAALGVANFEIFLNYTGEVTISYNVDGSITFYRGDDLMLTYAADTAIGSATVADLAKAMAAHAAAGNVSLQRDMEYLVIDYAKDYDPELENKPEHTLTIHYVSENGVSVNEAEVLTVKETQSYSVKSPAVSGYAADKTTVKGVMGTEDRVITVTYKPVIATVGTDELKLGWNDYSSFYKKRSPEGNFKMEFNFHHDSAGLSYYQNYAVAITTNMDATTQAAGDWYVRSDMYDNSVFAAESNKENTINWDNYLETVKDAEVTITVSRNGTTMVVETQATGANGESYTVKETVTDAPTSAVAVFLGGEACKLSVYSASCDPEPAVESHTLSVNYLFADGSKAADAYTAEIEVDGLYSVASPALEGYQADRDTVSGRMGSQDVTVTVTYKPVIAVVGSDAFDLVWTDYASFYKLLAPEGDFEMEFSFHHKAPATANYKNYSVAVTSNLNASAHAAGDWYMRADGYDNSVFGAESVKENNYTNWNTFLDTLKDAEVKVSVSRNGSTMVIATQIVGTNGVNLKGKETVTDAPTSAVAVFLGGEACKLSVYSASCDPEYKDPEEEIAEGLYAEFADADAEYFYTGAAIRPQVEVTFDGEPLIEGLDYTLSYKNNTKAGQASVTVKGKGNISGSVTQSFTIQPRSIAEGDGVEAGSIRIKSGSKAAPVLVLGSYVLKKNTDYTLSNNAAIKENTTITLTGKGNFCGERELEVLVVDKAELKQFAASISVKSFIYNAESQRPEVRVTDKKDSSKTLTENEDYILVFPEDTTSVGTVKFSVVGIGTYSGSKTLSYKITPIKDKTIAVELAEASYPFKQGGVKLAADDITVKDSNGTVLTYGADYRLSYSGNKKCGTATVKVTFIGNYKGSKQQKAGFAIVAAALNESTAELLCPDVLYTGKAGTYYATPYVSVDGVLLKKNKDYTVSYKWNGAEVGKKNKISLAADETQTEVIVEIKGKGNYAGDESILNGSYYVRTADKNLSKAKVSLSAKKAEYTGAPIESVTVSSVKIQKTELAASDYQVAYFNNVEKGTATVVIYGNGSSSAGFRKASFKIVANSSISWTE